MKAKVIIIDDDNFNPPREVACYITEPSHISTTDISERFYFNFEFGRLKETLRLDKELHKTPTDEDCRRCKHNSYDDPGECYECKSGYHNHYMSRMTYTKAMDLLDNLIGMIEDNQESDYDTAITMAIEALKKERGYGTT